MPFLLIACAAPDGSPYAERVEIRRTSYGVPHIRAEDLGALGYGLAWCHMEDYGRLVVERLTMARGELARHRGDDALEGAFWWARRHRQAVDAYASQHPDARQLFEGYAAAVNRYIELNPGGLPEWARPDFEGVDVAAHWVDETLDGALRRYASSRERRRAMTDSAAASGDGSNAWAIGPSRTASGHAMLLRNPHLSWGAGRYSAYYEAHITVPGVVDFYGDFRVGYPMYFNGGFNRRLGWSTTNNSPDVEEFYSLAVDPDDPDRYLLDGESVALRRDSISVPVLRDGSVTSVTREYLETEIGPVVERTGEAIIVVRSADWGEHRRTEQFLRMMQASSLEEWKDAMRMRAMKESSFTYADADGNIFYVWNAAIPALPHPSGRDTVALPVTGRADVWQELVPFDSLPQLLNPSGGYIHNENDSFHYTSLEDPIATPSINAAWPERRLRLRSQLGIELVSSARGATLEEFIELKHSPRMLGAARVKPDLLRALRTRNVPAEMREAADLLEAWDNTAAAEARGAALFELWAYRYDELGGGYARDWTPADPVSTPAGLDDLDLAVRSLEDAMRAAVERYGGWDVAWGDVHRVRWGDVDAPVSGCPSSLGCFRHLGFTEDDDGLWRAYTGDAWILAVEFAEVPRARSVLVFGQTGDPDSPHFDDQAGMFARGELKPVAFTDDEIERDLQRRYRPGE